MASFVHLLQVGQVPSAALAHMSDLADRQRPRLPQTNARYRSVSCQIVARDLERNLSRDSNFGFLSLKMSAATEFRRGDKIQ
ncbi:hypothetical protein I41_34510 [Lacipirellula limnantheis]|uniref:Uncharacterized protein n=1 Tax=Lacipirellula limnantheis TaxID=2528024 RepID=A0A517U0U7_9BACT|nr:hypothetical protein I41_34510 [Lacipirellula limnantheis]